MYEEYESPIVTKLKAFKDVVVVQVVETVEIVRKTEVLKNRDVLTAIAVVAISAFVGSKVLFGGALGYLVYHFVRRDDHVRNALEAINTDDVES